MSVEKRSLARTGTISSFEYFTTRAAASQFDVTVEEGAADDCSLATGRRDSSEVDLGADSAGGEHLAVEERAQTAVAGGHGGVELPARARPGPVAGAAFFLLLREGLSRYFTEYYLIPVGIIFTAMVIFMPQGILGFAKRRLNQ